MVFLFILGEECECSMKLTQTEIMLLMWSLLGEGAASVWYPLTDSKSQAIQIYLKQAFRMVFFFFSISRRMFLRPKRSLLMRLTSFFVTVFLP